MSNALYADSELFQTLREVVLPEIAVRRRGPFHVWVPACHQGSDAYTFAMLLEERGIPGLVIATDADESAIAWAMKAIYPEEAVARVPADMRERFLTQYHDHYRVSAAARQRVRFSAHSLAANAAPPAPGRFQMVSFGHLLVGIDPYLRRRLLACARMGLESEGLLVADAECQLARGCESLMEPSRYSPRILTAPGFTSSHVH